MPGMCRKTTRAEDSRLTTAARGGKCGIRRQPIAQGSQGMDELRVEIWDYLYRAEESKSVSEIAESVEQEVATIREVVEHEWFTIVDDMVTISRGAPIE